MPIAAKSSTCMTRLRQRAVAQPAASAARLPKRADRREVQEVPTLRVLADVQCRQIHDVLDAVLRCVDRKIVRLSEGRTGHPPTEKRDEPCEKHHTEALHQLLTPFPVLNNRHPTHSDSTDDPAMRSTVPGSWVSPGRALPARPARATLPKSPKRQPRLEEPAKREEGPRRAPSRTTAALLLSWRARGERGAAERRRPREPRHRWRRSHRR